MALISGHSTRARPFELLGLVIVLGTAECEDFSRDDGTPPPCDTPVFTCTSCHGSEDGGPAPPRDLDGSKDPHALGVGAHQSHLRAGPLRAPLPCTACHRVPYAVDDPGHIGARPAELVWGPLASTEGVIPTWNREAQTCQNYCHGATLTGGTNTSPTWTVVDGSQVVCGACHGTPPPAPHPANAHCGSCHVETMGSGTLNPDTHIDGVLQVSGDLDCGSCHDVPPATGSHLVHFAAGTADATYGSTAATADLMPSGDATGYAFGCGNCHPRLTTLSPCCPP